MINKNGWVLVFNGLNNSSITFKQDVKEDYNLIDLRICEHGKPENCLSLYLIGKKQKRVYFGSTEEGIKYLFNNFKFLNEFKRLIR